jgi:hypothetical protein
MAFLCPEGHKNWSLPSMIRKVYSFVLPTTDIEKEQMCNMEAFMIGINTFSYFVKFRKIKLTSTIEFP